MFSPDLILGAAAGVVAVSAAAFNWSAARSFRRGVGILVDYEVARTRAATPRPPAPPLPPGRPDWARDTTIAMRPVPAPAGGLRGGPAYQPPKD